MTEPRCPSEERLLAPDPEVLAHLAGCATCRDRQAGLAADDRFLAGLRESLSWGGPGSGPDAGPDAGTPEDADRLRSLVPGHRLGVVIARGGQGVVHEAVDESTGQDVAVKLVGRAGRVSTRERVRFEREARLAARLDHPGVARVLASGVAGDGRPYLVMERVHGVRLDEHPAFLDGSGGDVAARRRAVELLRGIAEAVAAAHGRGVIHRDLKPANVLVEPTGTPRVIDFGLARAAYGTVAGEGGGGDPTATGEFVGSLAYAAPEQLMGDPDVDARADVYALGVIGYEMLVGAAPHPSAATGGGAGSAIRDRIEREPRRPREIDPRIDGDLDAILHAAVRTDPDRRYPSAEAFARDLRLHLEGGHVDVRRDSRWYVLRRTAWRHRLGLSVAVLVMIVTSSAAIVATIGWRRTLRAERLLATRATQLESALLASDLEQARLALAAGDVPRAESLAWRVRLRVEPVGEAGEAGEAAASDEARLARLAEGTLRELYGRSPSLAAVMLRPGWAQGRPRWGADGRSVHVLLDGEADAAWTPPGGDVHYEAPVPGSRWVSVQGTPDRRGRVDGEGVLHLAHDDGGASEGAGRAAARTLLVAGADQDPIVRCWSDGPGRWLVIGHRSGAASLVDAADGGRPVRRFEDAGGRVAVSPDGRWVLVGRAGGVLEVWSLHDAAPIGTLASTGSGVACFSPDGTRLAVIRGKDVHLHRLPGLQLERVLAGDHRWLVDVAFDDAGSRLVAAGWDRAVRLWRVEDGVPLADWRGHTDTILGVRFSPRGDRIASVDRGGVVRQWRCATTAASDSADGDRGAGHRLALGGGAVMDLVPMAQGRRLAAGLQSGRVVILDALTGGIQAEWKASDAVIGGLAVLPDDAGVIAVDYDGGVHRFDLDGTVRWVARLTGPLSDVAVDPSGTFLAVAGAAGAIHRFDVVDGREHRAEARHEGRTVSLAFSPDGVELASAGHDGTIVVGPAPGPVVPRTARPGEVPEDDGRDMAAGPDMTTAVVRIVGRVDSGVARVVAYDPTGRWMAFAGDDRRHHVLDRLGGVAPVSVRHGGESVFALAFDERGRRLASIDAAGRLTILEGPPWAVVRSLAAHPTMGFATVFAPDEGSLVTAGGDGTVAWRRLDEADACLEGMRAYWAAGTAAVD